MRTAVAMLIAAAALAISGGSAGAGPCDPEAGDADGRIKFGSGEFASDDIFNSSGVDQTRGYITNTIETPLSWGRWKVRFENETASPQTIRVGAALVGDDLSFKARFYRGDHNVTDKVLSGGVKFKNVDAGDVTSVLKLKMRPRQVAQDGESLNGLIEGQYTSQDPCEADVVKAHIEINNNGF